MKINVVEHHVKTQNDICDTAWKHATKPKYFSIQELTHILLSSLCFPISQFSTMSM